MSSEHEPASDPGPSTPSVAVRLRRRIPSTQLRAGAVVVLVIVALVVAVLVSLLGSNGSVQTIGAAELSGTELSGDGQPVPGDSAGGSEQVASSTSELYVHVLGAVAAPGLYRVPDGARAFDAIAAAGGLLPEADPAGVNLARFVSDGEQLFVPLVGADGAEPGGAPGGAATGSGLVNLNTATAPELATLPRIGEALATRIIAWREANGRFTSVDDLGAVEGIGAKTLDGLRDAATV